MRSVAPGQVPHDRPRAAGYPARTVGVRACATRAVLLPAVLLAAAACHRTWQVQTTQPPLALGSTLDARTSLIGTIVLGDMELPSLMRLSNSAYFVAVSRDRLRFHVTLLHKWEEIADPTGWKVWIQDDTGRRYWPEDVDPPRLRPITRVYDRGRRWSVNSQPLYSVTFYRGDGDYVFYRRDLLRKNMRWLMLVMERSGYEYRYVWSFADPDDLSGDIPNDVRNIPSDIAEGQSRTKSIVPNRLSI
jgi:hypothetical protein